VLQIDRNIIKESKFEIIDRLTKARAPNISIEYPIIYLLPIFQNKIAFGNLAFSWNYKN